MITTTTTTTIIIIIIIIIKETKHYINIDNIYLHEYIFKYIYKL